MGKKKYSCESSESSVESKKHKKSSKKSKKHKSKKKKKRHSSSNESGSEDNTWIEKNVDKNKSPSPSPVLKQREDWMSAADNFFIPTFSKEKQPSKSAAEKAKLSAYDPATSTRELNPYYKTGEGGMPTFQRPKDEDECDKFGRNVKKMQLYSSGGWRKSKHEEKKRSRSRSPEKTKSSDSWRKPRHDNDKRMERSRSFSRSQSPIENQNRVMFPAKPAPSELSSEVSASHSDFLTDQQMNEIGAKMIKAEMMENTALYDKLKGKLDRAKTFKSSGKAPPKTEERELVVLSITNAAGTSRPVTKREEPHERRKDNKKRTKRVDTHVAGERMQYYPDDGKFDIKQMFEAERLTTDSKDQDIEFAKAFAKVKNSDQIDMADIFSDNIRKDKQKKSDDHDEAIREHQKMEKILDSCNKCFDSTKMQKELLVHVGKKIYMAIPYYEGIVNHHLVISPIQHVPCTTFLDEEVWEEVLDLKKALTQFFFGRKEDVVFFETVRYLNRRPHMEVHCVASSAFEMIQFYFKKAIQESEKSTLNKKLVEIKADKNIRRSVPKGLPYFWVDFGSTGMAHVIEDQETFPHNFAQEIIGGSMNLDVNRWRKPRKENNPKKRVDYFSSLLKSVLKSL